MAAFKAGEIDVLVATTVIEVGVDVPNATIMIVQEADRFGLAQLHQLRGRVGRGAEQSYCLLVSGPKEELTDVAHDRLEAMVATSDGFELAERDLEIRGEGQLLGARQSGLSDLHFTRLRQDTALARAGARGRAVARRRGRAREPRSTGCSGTPSTSATPEASRGCPARERALGSRSPCSVLRADTRTARLRGSASRAVQRSRVDQARFWRRSTRGS